ncbi:hypothetical protein DRQ25_00785 [Candidatus Fermentibacteria bacterium]|nr:MAG: hypothetical protein DRQ25_00785 [Candidatus Fermentibacteria bacterium]
MPASALKIEMIGRKELEAAIKRNPQKVLKEGRLYITRGLAVYKQGILRSPWRVGGNGGGAPVSNDSRFPRSNQRQRSGNLRDSHQTTIRGLVGRIGPNKSLSPYANFVHEGTRKMKKRPWLDHVKKTKDGKITKLYNRMLKNIVADLAE